MSLNDEGWIPPETVTSLHMLSSLRRCSVGSTVFAEDERVTYHCVGNTTPEIAKLLGWSSKQLWMPEHALRHIRARHRVIVDPIAAASVALREPLGVHRDHAEPEGKIVFYVDGDILRAAGLLTSQTTRYVSAGVELRHTSGEVLLRLFHLSPHRITRGERLWP